MFVFYPRLMFQNKCEIMKIFKSIGMFTTQLSLGINKFQSIMVNINNELHVQKVTSPMSKDPNNYIEFSIINRVSLFSII